MEIMLHLEGGWNLEHTIEEDVEAGSHTMFKYYLDEHLNCIQSLPVQSFLVAQKLQCWQNPRESCFRINKISLFPLPNDVSQKNLCMPLNC